MEATVFSWMAASSGAMTPGTDLGQVGEVTGLPSCAKEQLSY
jgi:hypothetical protein